MEYTLEYLVAEWKMRRGLIPLRIDATIRRQDAFEIDEYARRVIDGWYDRLLATAPPEMLEVEDITDRVTIEQPTHGVAVMTLPDNCVRLVEVMMTAWERPAIITGPGSSIAKRQSSPLGRGGACNPVAVTEGCGRVRLYSFRNGSQAVPGRVLGVLRPPEGIYRCARASLESLWTYTPEGGSNTL